MRRRCGTRGSATVELILLAPVLLMMLWFLVYCGRLTDTRLRIEAAAHQAARAATLAPSPPLAAAEARATAATALRDADVTCQSMSVSVHGTLTNGSALTVAVTCTVDLHDLTLLQVPGTTTLTADFTAPVDTYRSKALGFANSEVLVSGNRSVDGPHE
ncbi:TadE family protein [Streptomyces sp. 4F14]|uniref:TadE family protein n=1 Tax=Streptomyces sp. 4F14 TaxID=3394380 RepID=UPI003A877B66